MLFMMLFCVYNVFHTLTIMCDGEESEDHKQKNTLKTFLQSMKLFPDLWFL